MRLKDGMKEVRHRQQPRTHPYTLHGRQVDVRQGGRWVEVWECGLAHPGVPTNIRRLTDVLPCNSHETCDAGCRSKVWLVRQRSFAREPGDSKGQVRDD